MKIAYFINDLGAGGAERAVSGLANHWAKQHDISIITFVKVSPFYDLNPKIALYYCLEHPKSHTNPLRSLQDSFNRYNRLRFHLKAIKPDVILSFMLTANIYAIWACKWLRIPCIISERANHAIDHISAYHERIRNLSYPHSARLVVQTKGNASFYAQNLPKSKITVIPNAVAGIIQSERAKAIKRFEKVILNVGSFKNGKAQDVLIRAFSKLSSQDWQLVFLGGGRNLKKFKNLAKNLEVADRITFLGEQKDVAKYYSKSSMFVFTSEHEGFPNALLEALYFGLPSISTNCPHGPSDMIVDGENGFLVPVGDIESLSKKIQFLIDNESVREQFSIKALESSKKYEMQIIAKQWMKVINEVVGKV